MVEPDGLTSWVSGYDFPSTTERLRQAVREHGMVVLAEIDHAAAAATAGLALAPMLVLVFGDPRAGTPLMQAAPTTGIDLPLRALVWADQAGSTWLSYNDPGWIAARHGARRGNAPVLAVMRKALAAIAEQVTRRETGK